MLLRLVEFSSFVTVEGIFSLHDHFMVLALGHVFLPLRHGVSRFYNTDVIPPSNIYFSQAFAFFRDVSLALLSYATYSG